MIGGSAGAMEAVATLLSSLPDNFPAALCIVLHQGSRLEGGAALLRKIRDLTSLDGRLAEDGAALLPGRFYLCPPDMHLMITSHRLHLSRGVRVNHVRPAIDLAFRSAAVNYSNACIGVLLSGLLDDGVAGLSAIHRCGGLTVVQDPKEALYSEMPENAIATLVPDHVVTGNEMGPLLAQLVTQRLSEARPIPPEIMLEHQFDVDSGDDFDSMNRLGSLTALSCPDCGGPLWEISDKGPVRYRCHIGHSMTGRGLLVGQERHVEGALWTAVRVLEEKLRAQDRLARSEGTAGRQYAAQRFADSAAETRKQIRLLQSLLTGHVPQSIATSKPSS